MIRSTLVLTILLLALDSPAHALQILDASEGETLLARISLKEVTRIAFERGRIRRITGNAGEFLIEKDEDRGQIFLRPATTNSKPINLFLSSDRSTVSLLLQPVDGPGDSIVIREPRPASPSGTVPRGTAHDRRLKQLIVTLATDAMPEDMTVTEPRQEFSHGPGLRLLVERVWTSATLRGEKLRLSNVSATPIKVIERNFHRPGVLAVSVEQDTLAPGAAGNVFVIRERRGDE